MCYHLIGIASDIGWAQLLYHTYVFAMQIEPLISWDTAVAKSTIAQIGSGAKIAALT